MPRLNQQPSNAEWIVSILLVFCGFIPILAALLFSHPAQVPACKPSRFGNVVSDSVADGTLEFVMGGFVVHTTDNRRRSITHCSRGCSAPHELLKREPIGKPVHAEFCGTFLTMVSFDQVPIYTAQPPSQESLNETASNLRIVGIMLLLIFLVLLSLGLFRKRKT